MKRKALVTGGAGFIGSHLSRRLLDAGWDVLIIDNLSTGYRSNVPDGAKFIELDLSKESFVDQLPHEGVDVVFHLAAQSSGEVSFDNPAYDLKTNCLSTVLLLDWCVEKKVNRFIYTSSMSIYGDVENLPVKEDEFPRPKSFYGIGKLASENYLRVYQQTYGINFTALRFFNVYGPGQKLENLRQGMVRIYMAFVAKKETVLVKGSGDRFRDLVYVDDVVDATTAVVDNPVTFGQSYNVGTGKKTVVNNLIQMIAKAFGYDPTTYPIKYTDGTPGDQFGMYADISKIKKAIGWFPKIDTSEGIHRMVNWIKEEK